MAHHPPITDKIKEDEVIVLTLLGLQAPQGTNPFAPLMVLPHVKTHWPKYETEVMRRWFEMGRWGTRPAMFYHYRTDSGAAIYRNNVNGKWESELAVLTRLELLHFVEQTIIHRNGRKMCPDAYTEYPADPKYKRWYFGDVRPELDDNE